MKIKEEIFIFLWQ